MSSSPTAGEIVLRLRRLPEPWRTWFRVSFYLAAGYNLVWGVAVILFPARTLAAVSVETDAVGRLFWQCIGMFVLVYAPAYFALARQPERYAVALLVAVLGKVFGPIGFAYGAFYLDVLPPALGWTIVANDLLWWPLWLAFLWMALLRPARDKA